MMWGVGDGEVKAYLELHIAGMHCMFCGIELLGMHCTAWGIVPAGAHWIFCAIVAGVYNLVVVVEG